MNCPTCGKANLDGTAFCAQCGNRMQPQPAAVPSAIPATVPATTVKAPPPVPQFAYPAPPPFPAASTTQSAESFINSMSVGEKIAGAGAVAAIIGFFMPWISIAGTTTSYSGTDIGKTIGAVYLILLNGIASAIVCYLSTKATPSQKLMYAGYLTYFGALCGPTTLLSLIFVPQVKSSGGFGLWLFALGFTAVAAGGLKTIRDFSKKTY
jgi:hypothetical protein